jgi:hypothetical protein
MQTSGQRPAAPLLHYMNRRSATELSWEKTYMRNAVDADSTARACEKAEPGSASGGEGPRCMQANGAPDA